MDNTYVSYIVVLLILRIAMVSYCVEKAGNLNRNKTEWGIFGFIFPLVALIWIQFMKPVPKNILINVNPANPNITEKNEKFKSQKETLWQLKKENCLTDEEYEEKLMMISEQEKVEKSSREEELINQKVKHQIEPIVSKLKHLLESELLTKDEYDLKVNKLFSDKKMKMIENISTRGELIRIDYDQLSEEQKDKVKDLIHRPRYEGIILVELADDNVWSATEDEYINLKLDDNSQHKYKYVILPDNF